MIKRTGCALLLIAMVALCGVLQAQAPKTFTVKVFDGHTGTKIIPDNVEVFINRSKTSHVEWVKMNDDGTAQVTLPADANAVAVRVSYNSSMDYYVNCDSSSQKDPTSASWYPLADIVSSGVAMPNECIKPKAKPKDIDRVKIAAKPGEFVLFVRKETLRDRLQD
jgi:hypothetical protein